MSEDEDFERVDRLMAVARALSPTRDWSALLIEAGLDPSEVVVTVLRKRFRRAAGVAAVHSATGLSCESVGELTVEENAASAFAGLAGLMFDQSD